MRKHVITLMLSAFCLVAMAVPREQEQTSKIETVVSIEKSSVEVAAPIMQSAFIYIDVQAEPGTEFVVKNDLISHIGYKEFRETAFRWRSATDAINYHNHRFLSKAIYKKLTPIKNPVASRAKPTIRMLSYQDASC